MANREMTERLKYETIRDLKGFTEKYKRDDWGLEERCFSCYLTVLDRLIQKLKVQEGGDRFTGEQAKQYMDTITESIIREFDERVKSTRDLKTGKITLSDPRLLKEFAGNIPELNMAILYGIFRHGYQINPDHLTGINMPLAGIEFNKRNADIVGSEYAADNKLERMLYDRRMTHAVVHKVNDVIYERAETISDLDKQLNPELYLLDDSNVSVK